MIAVVDYGMGNLRSVERALRHVGADAVLTSQSDAVERADKVVVPGVGAFADAMNNIEQGGLKDVIVSGIRAGKPFLGICLGLQILFDMSEEGGSVCGLGVVAGRVVRFAKTTPDGGRLKVPHIGWNQVKIRQPSPLLREVPDEAFFYFDHSYYVEPEDSAVVAAETEYGSSFTSVLWRKNVHGTQFHPEKSQAVGLTVLRNFAAL